MVEYKGEKTENIVPDYLGKHACGGISAQL